MIAVCGSASAATIKMHVGAFLPMAGGHHGTVMMLTLPPSAPVGVAVLTRTTVLADVVAAFFVVVIFFLFFLFVSFSFSVSVPFFFFIFAFVLVVEAEETEVVVVLVLVLVVLV